MAKLFWAFTCELVFYDVENMTQSHMTNTENIYFKN